MLSTEQVILRSNVTTIDIFFEVTNESGGVFRDKVSELMTLSRKD